MKAAFLTRTGPPEVIQFGELPPPSIKAHQLRVKVHAVAVNPIDTYIRSGLVPMELPSPFVVGCDFAGVVEAVGLEVRQFQVGDPVLGS